MTFCGPGAGTREGSFAGGFPPEWNATLENFASFVVFKRPKRCNPFLDTALYALEVFVNERVYTRIFKQNYSPNSIQNYSPQAFRGFLLENGSHTNEISGIGEISCDFTDARERKWWLKKEGNKYPEYLKAITLPFVEYIKYTKEHKIAVHVSFENEEGCIEHRIIKIDYRTRFDDIYKWRVMEKLSLIEFKRCTHLTLTTDMKRYLDIVHATRGSKKYWDRVLKWIRRELERFWSMYDKWVSGKISEEVFRMYERNKCPFDLRYGIPPKPNELDFICVLEFSLKRGHGSPHLHILLKDLFFNVRGIRMIRKIMDGQIIKVRRYFNVNLAKYVLKYVKKAIVVRMDREGHLHYTSDIKKIVHASLYWITGCRMFSLSKHLEEEIKKKLEEGEEGREEEEGGGRKGDFEYIGVIPSKDRAEYPYSIDDALFSYCFGAKEQLRAILAIDYEYWRSRIRKVWSMVMSEWGF